MAPRVLIHRYVPHGAARRVFSERGPEVVCSGPAGTGKSLACLQKVHLAMLATPGARSIMLRKTATSLTSSALVTFREHVARMGIEAGDLAWFSGSAQEPAQYRYTNGSTLTVGGLDKATRIMSSEYDIAYVQEATELSENDWESITTRLRFNRLSYQQLLADCNPDAPTHWLKQRADKGQTLMLESRHADNPTLIDPKTGERTATGAAYLEKLERLTGVRRHRLLSGLWAAAEGVIYDGWDPGVHLISAPDGWPWVPGAGRRQPPLDWARWWSVDFGFVHPFVLQRWAEDPDGRLFLYAEHYRTRRLVEDHARDVLAAVTDERGRWVEPKPQAVLCDHDAEDRATLQKHLGLATQPAKKSVSDGIQAVAGRLKVQGDGRPRLFIVRDAVAERDEDLVDGGRPWCTEQEVAGYVWKDSAVKDEPVKELDDGMDCVRYVVAQRDLVGGYRMRWL